ncbi:S9 family peptidase [Kribbella sp. NPDC026611]|uniref:S9 family peptidase n=1 Tax=Kribbella sp. NPDC026611 TaxID=3154911 RepID=UPI0033D0A144
MTDLALSRDGSRLVATISQYDDESGKLVPSLWELDPTGAAEARRLTHSAEGESKPVFHDDGSLYFVSSRANDDKAALWRLPAVGEAEKVLSRPGGIDAVHTGGKTVVVTTSVMRGAADVEADVKLREERKTSGILHTASPTRIWDHELGPDELRLQVVDGIDLTPEPEHALEEMEFAVTPDGRTVIATWAVARPGWPQVQLVAIDTTTGVRRVLADDPTAGFYDVAVSHDGRYVAARRHVDPQPDVPPSGALVVIDLATGDLRDLVNDPDLWVSEPADIRFATDDSAVYFLADDHGDRPIMCVDLQTGELTRVTDDGCYANLQPAADAINAVRHRVDSPPSPVRVDLSTGQVVHLLPQTTVGKLERVGVTMADGVRVEGWLLLPDTTEPAPLVVSIHGGPHLSAGSWNWRWNNTVFLDAGYAVLQPDYSLSVGYGRAFIERGWEGWGATAYDDLMAITDAVVQRPDIDADRTAAVGGSFGGYLVNWIAGQTDRFRCLVSHAGIWSFVSQNSIADYPGYFGRQFGYPEERPERYADRSPVRGLANITTPMLVVHGSADHRVPVGEGLHLFNDLQRKGVESAFLSFPDEGHHVLKPANSRLWHTAVRDWLAKYL